MPPDPSPPPSSPAADSATVPPWLKSLPLAPEFRPSPSEFRDPIAYILHIEPEASAFGICKIIPPLPPPPKKSALSNLHRSLSARCPASDRRHPPTFTTRQQQVGLCPRRPRPAQKPVWQSGAQYTLPQFEAKASQFHRALLRKSGRKSLSPIEIESLFWGACADKPFSVEYANDMPGSGFVPLEKMVPAAATNVAETAWNMRGVARADGSLLRFMKEEIPGVTSPMIYVAMMFSWFAWHVEDHELHSLNYLHFGAGKTWYGVPRDAALAFEEVVRVHGYSGEVNPLVTFTLLGEKTTVMSPEVLVGSGIPCCRLVQNAGEFVVTFPGAYHSGFSHGFNCGEASNIATPQWLKVAKEAAIRRASINYPPMVSHYQLLYELALSLCSRTALRGGICPRSSRLKDKKKGEGEEMIKKTFVQSVIQNNCLLNLLLTDRSSCIVLPENAPDSPLCSNLLARSQIRIKRRLSQGLFSREEALEASSLLPSNDIVAPNLGIGNFGGFSSSKGKSVRYSSSQDLNNAEGESSGIFQSDGLLDQGLLSCVTCGILSFACVAVIQPREVAAKYLMSADYSLLNDHILGSGKVATMNKYTNGSITACNSGEREKHGEDGAGIDLNYCSNYSVQVSDHSVEEASDDIAYQKGTSALDLLASVYGDLSDSDELEASDRKAVIAENDTDLLSDNYSQHSKHVIESVKPSSFRDEETKLHIDGLDDSKGHISISANQKDLLKLEFSEGTQQKDLSSVGEKEVGTSKRSMNAEAQTQINFMGVGDSCDTIQTASNHNNVNVRNNSVDFSAPFDSTSPTGGAIVRERINFDVKLKSSTSLVVTSDKDSSRMHVFCLEHAIEVEKQLQAIGGAHVMLLCHPDYPKIEAEAKMLARKMETDYDWKDAHFREAGKEDQERIQAALEDEEAVPTNSDWAVKMGINLYYSASLSKSPLYSKQMPYNGVIYKAFQCSSSPNNNSPSKPKVYGRRAGRQKKLVVAGRWCGKVWMSNQVHPYLSRRVQSDDDDEPLVDQESKSDSDPDCSSPAAPLNRKGSNSTVAGKSGRKRRKKPMRKANTKKPRHAQENNSRTAKDPGEDSPPSRRVLRSSRSKRSEILSRKRPKPKHEDESKSKRTQAATKKQPVKKSKKNRDTKTMKDEVGGEYTCDIEGCSMSFSSAHDLGLHKRDICPVKGCGKKFFSHKYLVQHRKVHMDDRPLVCPWKGCKMTFKWPWARTEHLRVHTGDRPYVCREPGCGQTFRFVSDFSRHKRKTGHSVKKGRR